MNKYINNDISATRSFGKKVCQEVEIKKKNKEALQKFSDFGVWDGDFVDGYISVRRGHRCLLMRELKCIVGYLAFPSSHELPSDVQLLKRAE